MNTPLFSAKKYKVICVLLIFFAALPVFVYSQFTSVAVKISGSSDNFESFTKPTSSNRLCLIRGKTYTIRFSGKNLWLMTFNRIEITDGDFNKTFSKADLQVQTVDGTDRITIPSLEIPSSSDREDFTIKLRYSPETNGADICYAKVIERGSFSSAQFIGSNLPQRINDKVLLQPNITYRVRLTGTNLDKAAPFGNPQSLRSSANNGFGPSVSFTFSNVTKTATTLEMDVKHTRVQEDAPVTAKVIRITDSEADQNTPDICHYSFASTMPANAAAGTTPTNMTDWVAGYGTTLLPDLQPVPFSAFPYFRPLPNGVNLQASNGNVYMELKSDFANLLGTTNVVNNIQVEGLGAATEFLVDLPDVNFGVINKGVAANPAADFTVRLRRYKQASDNTGVITASALIQAVNFPAKDVSRQVAYVRPQVKVYRFSSQPGKVFLKRINATTPGNEEEFRFAVEVDPNPISSSTTSAVQGTNIQLNIHLPFGTGVIKEAREDNNIMQLN